MQRMIDKIIHRKGDIREAPTPKPATVSRLGNLGETLSRKNTLGAKAELCNEVLYKLTTLLYEKVGGQFVNIDPITAQVLIPMPTGWKFYRLYGLRKSEAVSLRKQLLYWQNNERYPWLIYAGERKRWYINLEHYPTVDAACSFLDSHKVDIGFFMP